MMTGLSITTQATALAAAIRTVDQLGGHGDVYNHSLVIAGHLAGSPLRSLEYVTMAPTRDLSAPTMIGLHEQTTDEIYVMVAGGEGLLTTNGHDERVGPADLVIAPKGTRHSLRNLTDAALGLLVVEVETSGAHREPIILRGVARELHGNPGPVTTSIDLAAYLSAFWGAISFTKLPGGGRIRSLREDNADQILFVIQGNATLLIEDPSGKEILREDSHGFGLSAFLPKGTQRTLINRASRDPLIVLTLNLRSGGVHA